MNQRIFVIPELNSELQFFTSRSSGPGGQNVNKVNSKVEVHFNVRNSSLLEDDEKELIQKKLESKITSEGILVVVSQRDRSQLTNKEDAINKLYALINKALKPERPRRATKPTRSSVEKRLNSKKIKSLIKQARNRIDE